MLGAGDARNHHSISRKKKKRRRTIRYPKSVKPMERGISIAVVEMGTDEPNEQVESIRAVGVGTQAPVYLRKKNEEDAREIGGGGLVSGDGFADHFMERSFPTADPCIGREAFGTLIVT